MHVVLLHGFGETSDIWSTFIPTLSPDNEYITLDYSAFTFCQTIEEYADWVHSEIVERKIGRFVLIGHSMGGYISLAYAKKYKDYLAGLGLFHSTAYADSEDKKKTRDKTVDFIEKYGSVVFIEDFLPKMYHPDFLKRNAVYIKQQLVDNQRIPTEALATATKAMRGRADTTLIISRLDIPTMMIIGKHDKFIDYQDALQQIPLCKQPFVLILDNSAHAGMIESPQPCAAVVNQFIKACV